MRTGTHLTVGAAAATFIAKGIDAPRGRIPQIGVQIGAAETSCRILPVTVIEESSPTRAIRAGGPVHDLEMLEIRTYISEPDRGPQSWIDQAAERDGVYANRHRICGVRGKRLLRTRGELLERPRAPSMRPPGARMCAGTRTCSSGCSFVLDRTLSRGRAEPSWTNLKRDGLSTGSRDYKVFRLSC